MSTPVEKMRNQDGKIITVGNSSASIKSVNTVSILVVDDDTTCLSIVAAILKKFQYEVLTVKHARDALCALRIKGGAFDLVVTDVHMPDMNGFELQQAIAREFDLPVVLMSADDQEAVVLKGLDDGAAFFIAKPVSPDDLRDLWQFASMKKKSQVVIEETGSFPDEIVASASSSVNEGKNMNKKDSKGKSPRKEGSHEKKRENGQSSSLKKPKVVWTNALHNRFLEAIRSIGLERAVPKKILEVMNVPGLTRENVASHLQKYRIFLRRVTDASFKLHCSTVDKGLKPRFTSSYSLFDRISRLQNDFPGVNIGASFLNQGASSSTLIPRSGFGQSRFLSNQGTTFQRSNVGYTNLVNQSKRALRFAQNNYQANTTSIQGHLSNMTLENLSRSYNAPINLGSTEINLIRSGTNEANSSVLNTGLISSDVINSSVPNENFEFKTTNYVGYNMENLRQLVGPGNNYKKNDGFKSSDGAINVPSDQEFQKNNNANSAINLDQLVQHLEGSSPSMPFHYAGGKELSDVIADYQKLLPTNQGNVEIGGEINHECYSPMFGLADFGIIPSPPPLEESDHNSSFPNEVNITNQVEQNGGDQNVSSSGFYGSTSHWDNNVPSFEQAPNQQKDPDVFSSSQEFGTPSLFTIPLPDITEQGQKSLTNAVEFGTSSDFNKTFISPNEREDFDFLESFLAPSPYGEDQTLEGI